MSNSPSRDEAPALVVRAVRVRPARHRRHAIVRIIGEELQTTARRTGVIHVIGDAVDEHTAA